MLGSQMEAQRSDGGRRLFRLEGANSFMQEQAGEMRKGDGCCQAVQTGADPGAWESSAIGRLLEAAPGSAPFLSSTSSFLGAGVQAASCCLHLWWVKPPVSDTLRAPARVPRGWLGFPEDSQPGSLGLCVTRLWNKTRAEVPLQGGWGTHMFHCALEHLSSWARPQRAVGRSASDLSHLRKP